MSKNKHVAGRHLVDEALGSHDHAASEQNVQLTSAAADPAKTDSKTGKTADGTLPPARRHATHTHVLARAAIVPAREDGVVADRHTVDEILGMGEH